VDEILLKAVWFPVFF